MTHRTTEMVTGLGWPASLRPTLEWIDRLAELEPDWDSYGADAPTRTAISAARNVVETLVPPLLTIVGQPAIPWAVAARVDGGVQIEWRRPPRAVEVHVGPDGQLGYLLTEGTGSDVEDLERDPASLADVQAVLRQALAA